MNSSTSQSLMGLMSQWQHIETNLTNFMIEAVLKLATFTEAGVFILIETSEGGYDVLSYC